MPKNKGKGGKNRRRGKNENEEKRELIFKEDGQEYAQVLRMLGNGRLEAQCIDGVKRLCHIRGKMRKKVWVNQGDIVLVGLRDYQDAKGDVILKYMADEARSLKQYGELPENIRVNDTDAMMEGDENENAEYVACLVLVVQVTATSVHLNASASRCTLCMGRVGWVGQFHCLLLLHSGCCLTAALITACVSPSVAHRLPIVLFSIMAAAQLQDRLCFCSIQCNTVMPMQLQLSLSCMRAHLTLMQRLLTLLPLLLCCCCCFLLQVLRLRRHCRDLGLLPFSRWCCSSSRFAFFQQPSSSCC